jgi:hypothetical protein
LSIEQNRGDLPGLHDLSGKPGRRARAVPKAQLCRVGGLLGFAIDLVRSQPKQNFCPPLSNHGRLRFLDHSPVEQQTWSSGEDIALINFGENQD